MHASNNGEIIDACKSREEAIAKQGGHCRFCNLEGHLTIYHKDYRGLPTRKIVDHNGEERAVRAICTAHCSCEVGKWMRSCTLPDLRERIPPLDLVGRGKLQNWLPVDPTLPDVDELEEPDWKAFRRQLAAEPPSKIIHVKPEKTPFRAQAYREMGEPVPTVQEQHYAKPN